MLTLPLEPTDDLAAPIFNDAAGCKQWLAQLQLTNLRQAQGILLSQIDELNRYPMRTSVRLEIMELLRETVGHVQHEFAKKLADKPLPLSESEFEVLEQIIRLWAAMSTGYRRCLQAHISGEIATSGALLCQRCICYGGLEILEYLHAGYEFDNRLWRGLHELYAHAETCDLHLAEVDDPLASRPASCSASYAKILLAAYANPGQMTRWQYLHMLRWLDAWSDTLAIEDSYAKSKGDAQPLAVDLSGANGLLRTEGLQHHQAMRYLAMVPVSKLLRVKTILLLQGQTPPQVGLGDLADGASCLELLGFLQRMWCEDGHKRTAIRRASSLTTQVCYKPEGIFAHLTGKPFKDSGLDSLALKQIQTLGYVQTAKSLVAMGYPLEKWQMTNESIMGACMIRIDASATRLRCRQLVAHRTGNSPYTMLCSVAWIRLMQDGRMQMGVRYLPGLPEAVRIHVPSINPSVASIYAPAFLLPPLPSIKTPASLIVPRDWFEARRIIEILHPDKDATRVRMDICVERGLDYERIGYTAL